MTDCTATDGCRLYHGHPGKCLGPTIAHKHDPSFTPVEIRRFMAKLSDIGVDYECMAAPVATLLWYQRPSAMTQRVRDEFFAWLAERVSVARGRRELLHLTQHARSVPEHEMARRADRITRMDGARVALEAA